MQIHIYTGARPVSNSILEKFGQRHIYFTTNPNEVNQESCRMHGDEVRVYSKPNLLRIRGLLDKLDEEGERGRLIWDETLPLRNVVKYILRREQFYVPDLNCSLGHFERLILTDEQRKYFADEAAHYFKGQERVDLYASLSGRSGDIQFTERAIKRKMTALCEKRDEVQKRADAVFEEIMATPLKPQPMILKIISLFRRKAA